MICEVKVAQSCLTPCDPWTVAHQAPLSMGFSRQEYWSGLPFPSPGDLPDPGMEPRSPTLQADALTSAPPGKPLNTRILTSKISKGGKEARLKEEGGGGGRGGRKGWPYICLRPPTDIQALWDFPLCLQRMEDWNSALPEIRPDQNQNLSSLPRGDQSLILSSAWGPVDQIPASRTRGLEKQGRIGRVKERKERGKGREVNKVSCSLLVGALWPVVCVRRRPGTKGSQLWPLGLVHW